MPWFMNMNRSALLVARRIRDNGLSTVVSCCYIGSENVKNVQAMIDCLQPKDIKISLEYGLAEKMFYKNGTFCTSFVETFISECVLNNEPVVNKIKELGDPLSADGIPLSHRINSTRYAFSVDEIKILGNVPNIRVYSNGMSEITTLAEARCGWHGWSKDELFELS